MKRIIGVASFIAALATSSGANASIGGDGAPFVPQSVWISNLQFVMNKAIESGAKVKGYVVNDAKPSSTLFYEFYKDNRCNFVVQVEGNNVTVNALLRETRSSDAESNILALEAHELGHCLTSTIISPNIIPSKLTNEQHILDEKAQDIFALGFMAKYRPEKFMSAVDLFAYIRNDPTFSYDTVHKPYEFYKHSKEIKSLIKQGYSPLEVSRHIVYNEQLPDHKVEEVQK